MKIFLSLSTLILFLACGQSPSKAIKNKKQITRNLQQDLENLIPEGKIVVDIMDNVIVSPRRQELMAKFVAGVQSNQEWYLQQQRIVDSTGQAIKYDPRIGLTKEEFEEYQEMMETMSDMSAASTGTENITITKSGGTISFKTQGKLSELNQTTIDVKNNTVKISDHILSPLDTICVTSADNVFKSAWRGYAWQYSDLSKETRMPTSQEELSKFSMTLYHFTIGFFESTSKTLIKISGSEIKEGRPIIKFEIPIVF